jgi:RNA polymerase sigma factor (sigma-70 family)
MTKEKDIEFLLWKNLKNGDQKDFSKFYDHYVKFLFSIGMNYSNDRELIKDSIHDLFVDLYKYRRKLTANVNVKGYLVKSLKRKIGANQKKAGKLTLKESIQDSDLSANLQQNFVAGKEDGVLAKLLAHINNLPKRQQEALMLKYQNELGYPEIAEIMGVSVESARTLIYRTIKSLRKKLDASHALVVGLLIFCNFLLK